MAKGQGWHDIHKGNGSNTRSVFSNEHFGKPRPANYYPSKMQAPGPVIIKTPADPEKLAALQALNLQYQLKKEPKRGQA